MSLPEPLAAALITVIHDENVARHKTNGAEPYVHADYEVHEQRIHRLVAALADGDEELEDSFYEALFDITLDGPVWMFRTFHAIVRSLRDLRFDERAELAATEEQLQASYERAYERRWVA